MNNRNANIENKLLAKDEFLQLDKLLNRFNVFEATDMGTREVKHTKFLAYLLNPNESHGLGEIFIKNFVTRISEKCENFSRILDLDFSFAEITPEFKLEKALSLDCLIKIPFRGDSTKPELIIAIENKINSKQGKQQLVNYSNSLDELFKQKENKFLIYLTFNFETPFDNNWKHITYEDVVLPAVNATLDILEETGSLHLKATLKNYYELMMEDAEGEKEKDELANKLIQDDEIQKYIKDLNKDDANRRDKFGQIYIKHKKAIDYLCQFDADKRTLALKWWKKLTKYNYEPKEKNENLVFSFESSIRRFLRFNLLTNSNRQNLISLAQESRKWLDSKCPIAFEIVLSDGADKIKCRLALILGPMDSYDERIQLLKALYPILNSRKEFNEATCGEHWNSLIANKSVKGEHEYPVSWIKDKIFIVDDHKSTFCIESEVIKLAITLNAELEKYFNSKQNNLSN